MAKFGEEVATVVDVVPTQPESQQESVPELKHNEHELSTGVVIRFNKKLPPSLAQRIVVDTFNNTNLGADGTVRDNMTNMEQLALAKRMFGYNQSLIMFGLSMGALEIVRGMPNNTDWLSALKMVPMVRENMPDVDFGNNLHQRALFLLYFGFDTEEDLELLSSNLLNG